MATRDVLNNTLAGETGTGTYVGANTPTLITPVIGAATGTSLNLGSSTTITGMIDDDSFATASSSLAASSESIKAYVDANAGGGGVTYDVTQANSFAVGDVITLSGTTYVDAQADSAANAEVVGVVSAATGSDFTVQQAGRMEGLTGLTAGTVYFLDPSSAGAYTATQPTTIGQIVRPVLYADTTTSAYVLPYRGNIVENTATNSQYDVAMSAGFDGDGVAQDIVVQPYAQLVMARTGSFTGESGYIDTAPTGAAAIVDVLKNGTTIYATPPQFAATSNTLTAGTLKTDGTEDFVPGDRITVSVTQIGSTEPGEGLRFTVTGEV